MYKDWVALDMGNGWAVDVFLLGKPLWDRIHSTRKVIGHEISNIYIEVFPM